MSAPSDHSEHNAAAAVSPGKDAAIADITSSWRLLTGGMSRKISDLDRRTLIACSGGADSAALTLALASATSKIVVAHVVHDLRPAALAQRDRDSAASLADALGLMFVDAHVQPGVEDGNAEAVARHLRYEALGQLARQTGCRFIATAHHADDQLETMLMALIRGAGPRGMAGIAHTRTLEAGLTLIRPMLCATREDAHRICRLGNWEWVEDETNSDATRLRAALRANVIPELSRIRPGVARRAVSAGQLQSEAADLVDLHVVKHMATATHSSTRIEWQRSDLAGESSIVLGAIIRSAIDEICEGVGLDRLNSRTIRTITAAITDGQGQERSFDLRGASILVTRSTVVVRREL